LDGFDNAACRSEETCELLITSLVTLRKGSKVVDVTTSFNNTAENHRLRVLFPTRLDNATHCHAESAFDVVERPIEPPEDSPWHGIGPRTYPMQRFVDVSDGTAGLAVINDGLREYEIVQRPDRTIAVTLLRAVETNICSSSASWETHPEMRLSQCPGPHEFRYRIYPHAGTWSDAEIYREVEPLALPMELLQAGAHGGDLPQRFSFLEIAPTNLVLSALKLSEDGTSLVVRVFNPTESQLESRITCFGTIKAAELISLEETSLGSCEPQGNAVRFVAAPKKIVTIRLRLESQTETVVS
jgi:alpha-mannosidase